jgi:hypothetical protein
MKRAIFTLCRWLMMGAAYALAYAIALHALALLEAMRDWGSNG